MKRKIKDVSKDESNESEQKTGNKAKRTKKHFTLEEYAKKIDLSPTLANLEVLRAYIDCANDPDASFDCSRSLEFICSTSFSSKDFLILTKKVIPVGYNNFIPTKTCVSLVLLFGENSRYYVGRNGSVSIYIRPPEGKKYSEEDLEKFRNEVNADSCGFMDSGSIEASKKMWQGTLERKDKHRETSGGLKKYVQNLDAVVGTVQFWWD